MIVPSIQIAGVYSALVDIATVIVTLLLAALFTFSASIKLLCVPKSLAIRDHLGVSPIQWRVIGALELAGVAGVLVGLRGRRSASPRRSD